MSEHICTKCAQPIDVDIDYVDCTFCGMTGRDDVSGDNCMMCNGTRERRVETAVCACDFGDDALDEGEWLMATDAPNFTDTINALTAERDRLRASLDEARAVCLLIVDGVVSQPSDEYGQAHPSCVQCAAVSDFDGDSADMTDADVLAIEHDEGCPVPHAIRFLTRTAQQANQMEDKR